MGIRSRLQMRGTFSYLKWNSGERMRLVASKQAHSHVDILRMYGHFGRIISPPWDAVHVELDERHGADAASDLFQVRLW